jgi:hypothetical protein
MIIQNALSLFDKINICQHLNYVYLDSIKILSKK